MIESLAAELMRTEHLLNKLRRSCRRDAAGGGVPDVFSGLNPAQERVLDAVMVLAPCRLREVAEYAFLSLPAASIAVKKLVNRKLLTAEKAPADRRQLTIRLSESAGHYLRRRERIFGDRLRSAWADCDEVILEGLREELQLVNSKLEMENVSA